jgi:pimeloyl-ACP methyl ester carboxylesterase
MKAGNYSLLIKNSESGQLLVSIKAIKTDLGRIDSVTYVINTGSQNQQEITGSDPNDKFTAPFTAEDGFIEAVVFLKDGSKIPLNQIEIPQNQNPKTSKLGIRGIEQELLDNNHGDLKLKKSFIVSDSARASAEPEKEIDLGKDDVIELIYDDGTSWLTGPDTLDDLFSVESTRAGTGKLTIPLTLRNTNTSTRGIEDVIKLTGINIFTKEVAKKGMKTLARVLENAQLGNLSGLHQLNSEFNLQRIDFDAQKQDSKPYILFIHGTNSSTRGSFAELKGSKFWDYVTANFNGRVLAFEHETLSKSPLENLLDLIKQLPERAQLHLITHSRGGIVGDLLCRFSSAEGSGNAFSDEDIEVLKKNKRDEDIGFIRELKGHFSNKNITIQKFIRVACPAHGTTLVSKRIDHILNIGFNLLGLGVGLAASPVYTAFKNLIAASVNTKNDPDILPGLEAMNPDSPFIQILNQPDTSASVDNPLFILSGNSKVGLNFKGLLIIASKLFYLKKNDLVVDTESMYMGTRRDGIVQFLFDEGSNVDHFNYFKNKKTQDALLNVLQATDLSSIENFRPIQDQILADEDTRNALLGLDGGGLMRDQISGQRPIAVLLPGIMGSNISIDNKKIWINYLGFLAGKLKELKIDNQGTAESIVKTSYRRLADYLDNTYDVLTYPFDWRLSLDESTANFNKKIEDLLKLKQPIKLIGHSMGGVLVRDFIVNHPETWKDLNNSKGFQLVFLGAPLGGSYRIPAVLFGMDSVIRKLDGIDRFHSKKELIDFFKDFPGILSLLPHAKDTDFSRQESWELLRTAQGDAKWPIPSQKNLSDFGNYRDRMSAANIDFSNISYIAGHDLATPSGHQIKNNSDGSQELVFLATSEGDASVTWETGIPKKLIADNKVYYVNVTHGELANEPKIFDGIAEIISRGTTNLLSRTRPSARSGEKVFRMPDVMDFDLSQRGVTRSLLGLGGGMVSEDPTVQPIRVSVSHGDLRYSTYPVLAGHFLGDGVLFAEKAIDWNMDGALSIRHQLDLYPGAIRSSQVLLSDNQVFSGAIIVGLGIVGTLTAFNLSSTVEQGVVDYVLTLKTSSSAGKPLGISSLIIGSEFAGLTIENSMEAIITGVKNANQKLARLNNNQVGTIDHIEFIELYEDRVLSAFYSLLRLEKSESSYTNIQVDPRSIKTLFGSKKRIQKDFSEEWWNRITVSLPKSGNSESEPQRLVFNASTSGAREEQKELFTSTPIIDELIQEISIGKTWSATTAKTLFELLVPNGFKEKLRVKSHINWVVDERTASYPWELLQDSSANSVPFCIGAGMVRRLTRETDPLSNVTVSSRTALVVADPKLNRKDVDQLAGAEREGILVTELLDKKGYSPVSKIQTSAKEIIVALFSGEYKIVHLAGHGIFNQKNPKQSGMLIGKDLFLTTFEIAQMTAVPELVFVNCCHLGRTDGVAEELYHNRFKLAANIGTQLIDNGVKAVIAAGWEVGDQAALDFTEEFYKCMFEGDAFGEAILKARRLIYYRYGENDNTWGAYQCYGDQFYRLETASASASTDKIEFLIAGEAELALNNLCNEYEAGRYSNEEGIRRLEAISLAVDAANLRNSQITEKEALFYFDLGQYESSLRKYDQLFTMEKVSASVAGLEKYYNTLSKNSVQNGDKAQVEKAIAGLQALLLLGKTAERYNLLGSAYKRQGFISTERGEKNAAYAKAAESYGEAIKISGSNYKPYPLCNWLLIEYFTGNKNVLSKLNPILLQEMKLKASQFGKVIHDFSKSNLDYWEMVETVNLRLCACFIDIADSRPSWQDVENDYKLIWNRAGTTGKKMAELEHLEILADILENNPTAESPVFLTQITDLRDSLTKLLESFTGRQ